MQQKDNHVGKHNREKLKNAFKDKFRAEISGYVSDLDINIYNSGRSSSSSNYNQTEKKVQNQNSRSLNNKNLPRPQSEMKRYSDFGPGRKRNRLSDHSEKSELSSKRAIVPLKDEELMTNMTVMPSFDDSSDSQASRNNAQNNSSKYTLKSNKNTTAKKTNVIPRSKSPGTRKF